MPRTKQSRRGSKMERAARNAAAAAAKRLKRGGVAANPAAMATQTRAEPMPKRRKEQDKRARLAADVRWHLKRQPPATSTQTGAEPLPPRRAYPMLPPAAAPRWPPPPAAEPAAAPSPPPRPASGTPWQPGRVAASPAAPPRPESEMLCRYGAACYRPDCKFTHPTAHVAQAPACREGWHCTRRECGFSHPPGVTETAELPFEARSTILGNGGRVIQEIRKRVRDAHIHVETDFDAERIVAEVKAVTPAALEHAREYLDWAAFAMVRRGFDCAKDITKVSRKGKGSADQCRGRYEGAIKRAKKRRLDRKLTKGEKREAKRVAQAYVAPVAPRFFCEREWDRFVCSSERARRPRPEPTHQMTRRSRGRQQRIERSARSDDDFYQRWVRETLQGEFDRNTKLWAQSSVGPAAAGSRKRGRDDDPYAGYEPAYAADNNPRRYGRYERAAAAASGNVTGRYERDNSRSQSRSRSRDGASYDSYDSGDNICGFSPSDAEELLCQGVRPWDDDAGDVLAALNYDDDDDD